VTKRNPLAADAPLTDEEIRLMETLRGMGATDAEHGAPSSKIERKTNLPHGPMMHALSQLERKGQVGRIVARKDVLFHVRKPR